MVLEEPVQSGKQSHVIIYRAFLKIFTFFLSPLSSRKAFLHSLPVPSEIQEGKYPQFCLRGHMCQDTLVLYS